MKVLVLRLEAPLMAFGGVTVDSFGAIDALPSASLLAGLIGNALGYRRTEADKLQSLQGRLRYEVRADRPGTRITDYQTAELHKDDQAWTTRGRPEGRAGGAGSYTGQHQRYRDFHADAAYTVALTLKPEEPDPRLESIAVAFDSPVRPLFLGRKPCLPSTRLVLALADTESLTTALDQAPLADDAVATPRAFRQCESPGVEGSFDLYGLRNWRSGVHEGVQRWAEYPWRTPS